MWLSTSDVLFKVSATFFNFGSLNSKSKLLLNAVACHYLNVTSSLAGSHKTEFCR